MVRERPGGIAQLCDLVDEHGDALEADFQQFYRLDLADVWRGAMSPRRALVLAEQLAYEPHSRYRAFALGGPEYIGWDRLAPQLAELIDATNLGTVVAIKAAGGKSEAPPPYPRPAPPKIAKDDVEEQPLTIDNFDIAAAIRAFSS